MTCKNCGNELTEGAKFCGKCGTKVDIESAATKEHIESGQHISMLQKYSKYAGIVYLILYAIILKFVYTGIVTMFQKLSFEFNFTNLASTGLVIGVIGGLAYKLEEYFTLTYDNTDIWLFGISIVNRKKIAKVAKIIQKVFVVIGSIAILIDIVPLFKSFGFSWMLVLAISSNLIYFVIVEVFEMISTVCDLE